MSEGPMPSAAETGAAAPPSSPKRTERTLPMTPEQAAARKIAEPIISSIVKASENKRRAGQPLSPEEQDLYAIGTIGRGFTEQELRARPEGMPLFGGAGLQVTGESGEQGTAVAIIKQVYDSEGRAVLKYECATTEPGKTITVSVEAMRQRFIQELAPSIIASTTHLPQEQQMIVSWYASGQQGDPPREAVAKELDPITQADRIIAERIRRIQEVILPLKTDKKEIAELTKEMMQLEWALRAKGELGPALKFYKLQQIQQAEGTIDRAKAEMIESAITALQPKAQEATAALQAILQKNGFKQEVIEQLAQEGIGPLLTNDKLLKQLVKIPNFDHLFFGTGTPSSEEVDAAADAAGLTPEQKAQLEKESGGKKGLLLVLLLLLASPILVGGGLAFAAIKPVQQAIGGGQQ